MQNIAHAIKGIAVKFISVHPVSIEFELQLIKKPDIRDANATKPKTQKSFIPWIFPLSKAEWFFVNKLVDPMNPKFHPIPTKINDK